MIVLIKGVFNLLILQHSSLGDYIRSVFITCCIIYAFNQKKNVKALSKWTHDLLNKAKKNDYLVLRPWPTSLHQTEKSKSKNLPPSSDFLEYSSYIALFKSTQNEEKK